MEYEWDENKERANVRKHGISFDAAIEIFARPTLTIPDLRKNYGELREMSIGAIDDLVIASVVHTDRGGVRRIISARPANRKERGLYYDYCKIKKAH